MGNVKKKGAAAVAVEPLSIGTSAVGNTLMDFDFDQLVLDETNARLEHKPDPQLLANIAAHGLLMPLLVKPAGNSRYSVVDGGRRYVTIKHGIETGQLPKHAFEQVPCRLVTDDRAALEISMSANLHLAMHPLDVCETVLELAKTEDDEKAIAAHFGQTIQWVRQRARLAELTEKAKDAYRTGRMDLGTAQLMTRLAPKDQDRLCKGKGAIYDNDVKNVLDDKSVDASLAMFDWQSEYPKDKVQYGLFDDIVLLQDVSLFKELQAAALARKHKELQDEGFNVKLLEKGDYSTSGKFVKFTGKVTNDLKPSLTILIKPNYDGLTFTITEPMIETKKADGVKKSAKKGEADTTDKAPTPAKATELSNPQVEILRAHIVDRLQQRILSGVAESEEEALFFTWLTISIAFKTKCGLVIGGRALDHNGPIDRVNAMRKAYPDEFGPIADLEEEAEKAAKLDFDAFLAMEPEARSRLYRYAMAAMIMIPYGRAPKDLAAEAMVNGSQIRPKEAFFSRYKTDQLIDYLKRSGVTKSSGGMPIDSKKATAVSVAVSKAASDEGWRFGIA